LKLRSDSRTCFHVVHCLPVAAAVRQVLPPLKLRLLQGTTHNGVAVTIHPASRR
jgi:hypothetical protein